MYLLVRVVEITGRCAVYKVGDSFRLEDGYRLVSHIPLCMHALAALLPFYNALRVSEPKQCGLAGKDNSAKAYIQCPDVVSYTGGGTVIFEISKMDKPFENFHERITNDRTNVTNSATCHTIN